MALGMLGEKYKQGKEGVARGARMAVEGIESGTGLRLSGALGWGKTGEDTYPCPECHGVTPTCVQQP